MRTLSPSRGAGNQLYAILNLPHPAGLDPMKVTRALLAGGVHQIQLRAKAQNSLELEPLAREMARMVQGAGASFVINDHLDLARAVQADLLHLGQEDLARDPSQLTAAQGAGLGVGLSTHSPAQFLAAQELPLAYVAIGPVYPTRSKSNPQPCVGPSVVQTLVRDTRHPVVAIGGITAERAASLWSMGVSSVAVIGALEGPDLPSITAKAKAFAASPGLAFHGSKG